MAVTTFDIDAKRRDYDVAADIARYQPDATQFAVILMKARKKASGSEEFIWYDEDIYAGWTQVNNGAGYTSSATSVVVDDGTVYKNKDLLKVPRTGEVMRVTAVSTNTLTVTRGYSGTTAAALLDNDYTHRLANAMEENSQAPDPKQQQPTKGYNYIQTIRTPFDESMADATEDLKTKVSERQRLRKSKMIDHRIDLERIALFGERYEDTTNKIRTTGGILSFATTNVKDYSDGIMSEKSFEQDVCEVVFAKGSKTKLMVCSRRVASVVNQFAVSKIEVGNGDDTYGIRLAKYKSFHGDLMVTVSDTLEYEYNDWAVILDMENIAYRPKKGRDTRLRTNIQENDRDGWKDEYATSFGMEVRLEATHMVLKNIAG